MIPFMCTLDAARDFNKVLEKSGPECGGDGLNVNMAARQQQPDIADFGPRLWPVSVAHGLGQKAVLIFPILPK